MRNHHTESWGSDWPKHECVQTWVRQYRVCACLKQWCYQNRICQTWYMVDDSFLHKLAHNVVPKRFIDIGCVQSWIAQYVLGLCLYSSRCSPSDMLSGTWLMSMRLCCASTQCTGVHANGRVRPYTPKWRGKWHMAYCLRIVSNTGAYLKLVCDRIECAMSPWCGHKNGHTLLPSAELVYVINVCTQVLWMGTSLNACTWKQSQIYVLLQTMFYMWTITFIPIPPIPWGHPSVRESVRLLRRRKA